MGFHVKVLHEIFMPRGQNTRKLHGVPMEIHEVPLILNDKTGTDFTRSPR